MFSSSVSIISNDVNNPSVEITIQGKGIFIEPATAVCYASTGSADGGRLLTIDTASGIGTIIGLTGLDAVPALAINSQGKIYGADGEGSIYRLDAETGKATFLINPNLGEMSGMAFNTNDTLYLLGHYTIYTLNLTSGKSRFISATENFIGLAFDPTDASLWGCSYKSVYRINPSSGVISLIGDINLKILRDTSIVDLFATALHFDREGNLFATMGLAEYEMHYFASINKNTGHGAMIGPIGYYSVKGLAINQQNIISIEDPADYLPDNYALEPNYPNPFNPITTIRYRLKKPSKVNITIYDNLGCKIIELVNIRQDAGYHQVIWDGKNYLNQPVSSGIYFYRLSAENFTAIKKMILIR